MAKGKKSMKSRSNRAQSPPEFSPTVNALQSWEDTTGQTDEDAFHAGRDKVALEEIDGAPSLDELDFDEEVFPLYANNESKKSHRRTSLAELHDENDQSEASKGTTKKRRNSEYMDHLPVEGKTNVSRYDAKNVKGGTMDEVADEVEEESDEDSLDHWHPSAYHVRQDDGEDIDVDSENEDEIQLDLAETRRIQRTFRNRLSEKDFGLHEEEWELSLDDDSDNRNKQNTTTGLSLPTSRAASASLLLADDAPTTFETREEEIAYVLGISPELQTLAKDYLDNSKRLKIVRQYIESDIKDDVTSMASAVTYEKTLSSFLSSLEKLLRAQFRLGNSNPPSSFSSTQQYGLLSPEVLRNLKEHVSQLKKYVFSLDEHQWSWEEEKKSSSNTISNTNANMSKSKLNSKSKNIIPDRTKGGGKRSKISPEKSMSANIAAKETSSESEGHSDISEGLQDFIKQYRKQSNNKKSTLEKSQYTNKKGIDVNDEMNVDKLEPIPFPSNKKSLSKTNRRLHEKNEENYNNIVDNNNNSDDQDDFIESIKLSRNDKAEKAAGKKSLKFYTSKIDAKEAKRQGNLVGGKNGMNRIGGDEDVPYRNKEQIRRQVLQRQNHATNVDSNASWEQDADNDHDEIIDARKKRKLTGMELAENMIGNNNDIGNDDDNDDDDDYYDLVKASKSMQKEAKKQEYDQMRLDERNILSGDYEADENGNPRAISRAMLKNKGLTPKRSKEVRNPRVKKRQRYAKAQKKISSMHPVYSKEKASAAAAGAYRGESTGIARNTVKSRKLIS